MTVSVRSGSVPQAAEDSSCLKDRERFGFVAWRGDRLNESLRDLGGGLFIDGSIEGQNARRMPRRIGFERFSIGFGQAWTARRSRRDSCV